MYADALVQAVIESPEDDTPRLVFADFLEENGDEDDRERAEFVRLQCRLAAMAEDDPGREALAAIRRPDWVWDNNFYTLPPGMINGVL